MRKSGVSISFISISVLAFILSFFIFGGSNKVSNLFTNVTNISNVQPTPPPASEPTPKPYTGPIVSIDFDDGWKNAYVEGLPILDKHGFKATNALISSTITAEDSGPYMEPKDVKNWLAKGNMIGSHSIDHSDLSTMSEESMLKQGKDSKAKLEAQFNTNIEYLVYPFCASSDTSEKKLNQFYTVQRVCGLSEPTTRQIINPKEVDSKIVEKGTTTKEIQEWLDEAKKNNSWLILVYHKMEKNPSDYMTISPEAFAQQMQMLADSKIKVLPAPIAYKEFMAGKEEESRILAQKKLEQEAAELDKIKDSTEPESTETTTK